MKTKKIILLLITAFLGAYLVFRWSGVLMSFQISSSSNEPNLRHNSRFVGSSLKSPKRLDFAYFKFSDSLGGLTIVKRLIAIPGDTLECKNGYYFINGNQIDEGIDLRFQYRINKKLYNKEIRNKILNPEAYSYYNSDTVRAFLDDSFVRSLPIKLERYYDKNKDDLSKEVFLNHSDWTINNFGPIVLPREKYFFSGDNRDNSYDSRWRGFVDEDNICGTLLFQFE